MNPISNMQLDKQQVIDLSSVYINEGVKKDFELFWPRLEKGGFITFHDILGKGHWRDKWKFGVWKLWKELEKTHQSICFPKHPGLGVIQKA